MIASAILLCFALLVIGSNAIVCLPDMCENAVQPPLNCPGKEIKGGGVCGCTDVCPGKEGEACTLKGRPILGVQPLPPCDDGLTCRPVGPIAVHAGICKK